MGALSQIYAMSVIFLTIILLELVVFVRSTAKTLSRLNKGPITTTRYLQLIEQKIPTVRFRRGIGMMDRLECRVCLSLFEEGEEIRKLSCRHMFHKDCLDTWLQHDHATCPLCRCKVLPEDLVVRYRLRLNYQESDAREEAVNYFLSALHNSNLHRLM